MYETQDTIEAEKAQIRTRYGLEKANPMTEVMLSSLLDADAHAYHECQQAWVRHEASVKHHNAMLNDPARRAEESAGRIRRLQRLDLVPDSSAPTDPVHLAAEAAWLAAWQLESPAPVTPSDDEPGDAEADEAVLPGCRGLHAGARELRRTSTTRPPVWSCSPGLLAAREALRPWVVGLRDTDDRWDVFGL